MGKKSGITKGGRSMNPADRERKQQRAKELKRNKKQRTAVRQAIVKGRDPDQLIESLSRLDDQEFDPERQLSLNVIQEKRSKLRGAFYQVINLYRQEKNESKIKNLERMMFDYEVERARKEENYRAQVFAENADFEGIPLPSGNSVPEAANTPFTPNISTIGPQMSHQIQPPVKGAGILKKSSTVSTKKKHKYPPGPPPGLPPILFDRNEEQDEDDNDQHEQGWNEGNRRRVRFGEEPRRRGYRTEGEDEEHEQREYGDDEEEEEEEDEDYAPVEIPEGLLLNPPVQSQQQPVYSRPVPSLAAPTIGSGPIMPQMAPPPPAYPSAYQNQMPSNHPIMPHKNGHGLMAGQQPKMGLGLVSNSNYPPDPHPSAIISAEPQVVKPNVIIPSEKIISAAPQMRNITRESTRFVPTAVKIQRPIVPSVIGPKIPTLSVAGPTKLVPRNAIKPKTKTTMPANQPGKSVDEACDDFLKELQGLL